MATEIGDQQKVYDYIICGGGTSACAIAGRLAEDPSITILLIEAGDHSNNVPASQMAGGASQIVGSSEHDWNIIDEPCSGLNNRQVPLSRGKVLGGSSSCNGTLCVRGMKADYDDWGLEGWSGDEVFKYMSKAETFHGKPWFKADESSHGTTGPIHTEPHDPAPISSRLLTSFESKGLPLEHDMFSKGETAHGCGYATRTVTSGFRVTASSYLTKSNLRSNVTILTKTLVDKIRLEKEDTGLKATGVDVVLADRSRDSFKARKEVVVSAGAYNSPSILLRSGVGPKDELMKHGITSEVDLPGVGKNLMDHLIVFSFYEVTEENLTTDHQVWHGDALKTSMQLWMTNQTGFLSSFPFGAFAYARLDDRLSDVPLWKDANTQPGRDPMGLSPKQPNIEFFSTECYGGPSHFYKNHPINGNSAFAMITELFNPRSRGTVELKSTDPADNPIVNHNYLRDPLDLLVLAEGCRLGNEIVLEGSGTKDIIKGSWPSELTHHTMKSSEEWMTYVKENATTCYHPASTCAMGLADNPLAVLDNQLRVRGVKNLRVADVSAMPTLSNGHPQMAAYAIGEKAADLLKAARE